MGFNFNYVKEYQIPLFIKKKAEIHVFIYKALIDLQDHT